MNNSARIADAMREAYADLFELNVNAHTWTREEVKNKLKTLTQGQFSDDVLSKMASTFTALAAEGDFAAVEPAQVPPADDEEEKDEPVTPPLGPERRTLKGLGELVYNIQIQLPESRDPAVYDALFRSMKTHLFHE